MEPITVTQLNTQIKSLLEGHFEIVLVEGEVSKAVYHISGHLYFTIKDENSSINCAMWKSNLSKLKFKVKPGEKVLVYGAINLYVPRGEYKLIAQSIEPSGIGALQRAYEQLKEELNKLGYFDISKKKSLPKYPKRIALVTSPTAAALEDMLKIAKKRWRLTKFYLFSTLVQGEGAAEDIARNIKLADNYRFEDGKGFDLIIIGRGGGSKEDLWAFNERIVADAIFQAKTPIISAVGHEIDYLISDFVADKRASTPSNAIEIALPDENEILMMIDEIVNRMSDRMKNLILKKENELNNLVELLKANSIEKKIFFKEKEIEILKKNFFNDLKSLISIKQNEIDVLKSEISMASPLMRLEKELKEIDFLKRELLKLMKTILSLKEKELEIEVDFKKRVLEIMYDKEREIKNLNKSFELLNPKKVEKKGFAQLIKDGENISLEDIKEGDVFELVNTSTKVKVKALELNK